jgi:hypothetical protein
VRASGHLQKLITVRLDEGARVSQDLTLGPAVIATASPASRTLAITDGVYPPPPSKSPLRTIGWSGVGVGSASLVAAGFFGLMTIGRNAVVSDHCQGRLCDAEGFGAAKDGRTYSTISTVTFAVGGALLVASVVMLLLAPNSHGP